MRANLWLIRLISLFVLLGVPSGFAQQTSDLPFYFGVDLSYVNEMEDCGAQYRVAGEAQDPFNLFAQSGASLVRARLWHNPDWTNYSDLEDVMRTFQRAQDAGMGTLLSIHYSDNWADPSRQEIPAAWQPVAADLPALAQALYDYTYETLTALHEAGLKLDFVQVGNETNSGMLLMAGEGLNWPRQSRLFSAGIRAIRDFSAATNTAPQIVLHVAQPENAGWWFTEAEAAGITDFDVIGLSYYPQWSVFSVGDVGAHAAFLRQRFAKPVMVVETAYGWTREAVVETASNILNQGLRGYPFTPQGQQAFMTDLSQSLISNGALGVVYWEPAWVSTGCSTRWGQGSHWENATFFDFRNNNELLPSIHYMGAPYWLPQSALDGMIEAAYGEPFITDSAEDVLDGTAAYDLRALYLYTDEGAVHLALQVAGNVFSERGHYLIYIDTTQDESGATSDPARRPITMLPPNLPEYRLDITLREERGTLSWSIVMHQWLDEAWAVGTFTGGASIQHDTASVIDLSIPRSLLGDPAVLSIAVVSTNQGRTTSAGDILGTDMTLSDWSEPLTLDTFFSVPLAD